MELKKYFENAGLIIDNIEPVKTSQIGKYQKISFKNPKKTRLNTAVEYMNLDLDINAYLYKNKYVIIEDNNPLVNFEPGILGVNPIGEKIPLPDFNHCLIGGRSGSGKSVAIRNIVNNIKIRHPDALFMCIDLKGGHELLQVIDAVAVTQYGALNVLKGTKEVMDLRIGNDRNKNPALWDDTNGKPFYLLIDELAELTTGEYKAEALELLRSIVQLGRAFDVHVIAATQAPLAKIIPTELRINFDFRIGLKTLTEGESRTILGVGDAAKLNNRGSAYIIHDGSLTPERVQIGYIDPRPLYKYDDFFDRVREPKLTFLEKALIFVTTYAAVDKAISKTTKKLFKW